MPLSDQDLNQYQEAAKLIHEYYLNKDNILIDQHPLILAAGPWREEYYKAMEEEMEMLETKMDPWEVVPQETAGDSNILDMTWAYKKKVP